MSGEAEVGPHDAARDALHRDGYVVMPGACRSLVPQLRALSASMLERAAADVGLTVDRVSALTSAWNAQGVEVSEMVALAGAALLERIAAVTEVRPQPVDASLFIKSTANGLATHAHQDIAYKWQRAGRVRYALTSWLALDACSPERGALIVGPGPHDRTIAERQDFLSADFADRAASPAWRQSATIVSTQPGDVVVFSATTWHAAQVFRGPGTRRALAVRWASQTGWERAVTVPSPRIDRERFGMDTSGSLLIRAIERGCSERPDDLDAGGTLGAVRWINGELRRGRMRLPESARCVLNDLEAALTLLDRHGARPAASVWLKVRDVVMPALLESARSRAAKERA
ncbi:MAG: phytanoyl-CoA dioxygenase family protein [Myxococcota bacterium]